MTLLSLVLPPDAVFAFDERARLVARISEGGLGPARALHRQASVFWRLLANPPFRPFSRFASCLASLRTRPPNLPSATACGFLPADFFIAPLHFQQLLCAPAGYEKDSSQSSKLTALF